MAGFFSHFDVGHKPDGTSVTTVDRRVELALRGMIEDEHPSMGILGEEFGMKPGLGRWVIDPVDGTVPFIDGDPADRLGARAGLDPSAPPTRCNRVSTLQGTVSEPPGALQKGHR